MNLVPTFGIFFLTIGFIAFGSAGCKSRISEGQLQSSQSQTTMIIKDQFGLKIREWYQKNIESDQVISADDLIALEFLFKQYKGDLYSIMDFSELLNSDSAAPRESLTRNLIGNTYFSSTELNPLTIRDDEFYLWALANAFKSAPILSDPIILENLKLTEQSIVFAKSPRRAYSFAGEIDNFQIEVSVVPNLTAKGGYVSYKANKDGQSMNLSTEMQNHINSKLPLPKHIVWKDGQLIAFKNERLVAVKTRFEGDERLKQISEKLRRVGFLTGKPDKDIVSKEVHHKIFFPILLRDSQLTLKALLELGASENQKSLYMENRIYHLVELSLGKKTVMAVTSEVEKSPDKIDPNEYNRIKSRIEQELKAPGFSI